MLKPRDVDNSLFVEGRAEVGDKYPDICCQGHEWEAVYIFPDADAAYDSIWGVCCNPDCQVQEDDSYYRGVSHHLAENLALKLLEQEPAQP